MVSPQPHGSRSPGRAGVSRSPSAAAAGAKGGGCRVVKSPSMEPRRRLDTELLLATEVGHPSSLATLARNKPTLAHLSPPKGSRELSLSPRDPTPEPDRLSPTSVLDPLTVLPSLPARVGQLSALKNRSRHPSLPLLPRVHTAGALAHPPLPPQAQRPLTSFHQPLSQTLAELGPGLESESARTALRVAAGAAAVARMEAARP